MVSLLKSEGHVQAHHYPIWMLWEQLEVVRRRLNAQTRSQATSMLVAFAAVNGGRKGMKAFKEYLEKLGDGED